VEPEAEYVAGVAEDDGEGAAARRLGGVDADDVLVAQVPPRHRAVERRGRVRERSQHVHADAAPFEHRRRFVRRQVLPVVTKDVLDRVEARHQLDAHAGVSNRLLQVIADGSVCDEEPARTALQHLPLLLGELDQRFQHELRAVHLRPSLDLHRDATRGEAHPHDAPWAEHRLVRAVLDPRGEADEATLSRLAGEERELAEPAEKQEEARIGSHRLHCRTEPRARVHCARLSFLVDESRARS
jgi:hypothetical protein